MNRPRLPLEIFGVVVMLLVGTVGAQDKDACFFNAYHLIDKPATIAQAQVYVDEIQGIIRSCNQQSSPDGIGSGTFDAPYVYGEYGEVGTGLSLKVSDFTRGNVSPHRYRGADRGYDYVKVRLDISCDWAEGAFCPEVSGYRIKLIGDNGEKYDRLGQVYQDQDELNSLELRKGSDGFGTLLYQVADNDRNLLLIYEYSFGDDDYLVYGAEPSLENAIYVTANRNVNVRSGPGTSYGVKNGLSSGEQVAAIGRNADSTWVETVKGWVFAQLVSSSQPFSDLPIVSN